LLSHTPSDEHVGAENVQHSRDVFGVSYNAAKGRLGKDRMIILGHFCQAVMDIGQAFLPGERGDSHAYANVLI